MMSSRSATPEARLPSLLPPTPLSSPAESNECADSRAADFSAGAKGSFQRSSARSLFHATRASVSAASSANASSTAHRAASSSFATANKSTNELSFLTGKTISPLASRPSGVTTASIRLLFSSSSSLNRVSALDAHSRESSMVPMPTPATWASMKRRHVSEIAIGSFAESTTGAGPASPPREPPAPFAIGRILTRSGVLGSRSSRRWSYPSFGCARNSSASDSILSSASAANGPLARQLCRGESRPGLVPARPFIPSASAGARRRHRLAACADATKGATYVKCASASASSRVLTWFA